jgi:hypothetical protein
MGWLAVLDLGCSKASSDFDIIGLSLEMDSDLEV